MSFQDLGVLPAFVQALQEQGIQHPTPVQALQAAGILYVVYRRNPKGNSKKNPVILFKHHQYFAYWVRLLNLDVADKNSETLGEASDKTTRKVATIHIT